MSRSLETDEQLSASVLDQANDIVHLLLPFLQSAGKQFQVFCVQVAGHNPVDLYELTDLVD